ncbi:MAG: 30S ribosomal protein S11 [Lentisphaeria bacterium]|nr:30S ribosomal protein S11 [Lentisphaeria bacterium]
MPDEILETASTEPQPQPEETGAVEAAKRTRVRGQRHIPSGIAFVDATFNNTKVSISDMHGNIVAWCSGGRLGFKGSRKSTAYVAQQIGAEAARRAVSFGMREVEVRLRGPGAGRESAVRGLVAAGLEISLLKDITPLPHNGCRPPKRRRV